MRKVNSKNKSMVMDHIKKQRKTIFSIYTRICPNNYCKNLRIQIFTCALRRPALCGLVNYLKCDFLPHEI